MKLLSFIVSVLVTSRFKFVLIVFTFFSIMLYTSTNVFGEIPEKEEIVESQFFVKGMLGDLSKIQRSIHEKKFFPADPPNFSRSEVDKCREIVDENLRVLNKTWLEVASSFKKDIQDNSTRIKWQRNDRTEIFLALLQTTRKAIEEIEPKYDPNVIVTMNVVPVPDVTDNTGQLFLPGVAREYIKHPKTRLNYEKAIWENTKNILLRRIHGDLNKLIPKTERVFREYVLKIYSENHETNQELIDLLEKYEYPMEERIKLLADLNIPYKGFRNWESTDKLFKATAKFISLEKGEVNLEKADNKKTSIEFSALRKEDQDYVKKQLESEKKTVDDEKVKKD
jgi:hypothetical protein